MGYYKIYIRYSSLCYTAGPCRLSIVYIVVCICWASLIAQLVKNPPSMQETPVRLLGQDEPLEKGKSTHSSILAWRIPWTVQLDLTE